MITIFAIPKPFEGHFSIIQQNAINSWFKLNPKPEIILFGEEKGTEEICNKLGLIHIPEVKKNEYGTPLLNDAFRHVQLRAKNDSICYINSDILLTSNFIEVVNDIIKSQKDYLIIGRRWDLDLTNTIKFDPGWENKIIQKVKSEGKRQRSEMMDFFVFANGKIDDIPPFAVGRPRWDNWLVWKAKSLNIPVIDVSDYVIPIHQNHDYSHHPGSYKGVYEGDEARINYDLSGGLLKFYKIIDADFIYSQKGLKRNISLDHYHWKFNRIKLWLQSEIRKNIRKFIGSFIQSIN
jgi:hypothetical protein